MNAKDLNQLRQTPEDPSRVISSDGSVRPAVDTGYRVGQKTSHLFNRKKDVGINTPRSWGADGT